MLQDSEADQIAFLKEAIPWMNAEDWIERHPSFGVFATFLTNAASMAFPASERRVPIIGMGPRHATESETQLRKHLIR